MKEEFIPTGNYIKMKHSFSRLKELPPSAPKIGLGYGNFGLGKTFSLEKIAAEEDAVLLRAAQTWTKSALLTRLCQELNLDEKGSASVKYQRVLEALLDDPVILIIDEIDALLRSTKTEVLELLRDLHDEAGIILFMVGMEEANAKLKRHKHYYSRIVEFVFFQQTDRDDIAKLCALCEVHIEDDLIDYLAKSYPNLRQTKVLLLRLESWCELNDIETANLQVFKKSEVEYGDKRA